MRILSCKAVAIVFGSAPLIVSSSLDKNLQCNRVELTPLHARRRVDFHLRAAEQMTLFASFLLVTKTTECATLSGTAAWMVAL